jgi:hypothetical protein
VPTVGAQANPLRSPHAARWIVPGALLALFLSLIAILSSLGGPHTPLAGLAAVLYATLRAGAPALAYLAGGIGLGTLLRPVYAGARQPFALQAALGLSLLLTLSHLLGCSGLLGGRAGLPIAAGVCGAGLFLLARQIADVLQDGSSPARVPFAAAAALPAFALLLVASSNPPGWLWDSEARAYDAQEYHLQLPQEWLALGQVRPLEHNVYSYLPGYLESAFYHMAVMTGAPSHPTAESPAPGLLASEGMGVLSTQFLHAGFAIVAAIMIAGLVLALVARAAPVAGGGIADDRRTHSSISSAAIAGALFLSIPWIIVTGSLPYNDLAVCALLAPALIAAIEPGLSPARRGMIVGLLIGVACGVKPTALLLGAPPAATLLLGTIAPRRWPAALLAASISGLCALSPWLVRNWLASGNPVFPEASALFGTAHWSHEQISRYAAAHHFDGSLVDRFRLMLLADPSDPAGPRHRGLLHPQWSIFFALVLIAIPIALVSRHRRMAALMSVAVATQLAAWLFATHIQSRFLIPLAVPGASLIGLAIASLAERTTPLARAWPLAGAAATLFLAAHAASIFADQGSAAPGEPPQPNALLIPGPPALSGEDLRPVLMSATPAQRNEILQQLGPRQLANLALPRGSRLYLLGESTPLYYTVPVIYATTYDRSLLAAAISSAPGDPVSWSAALRAAGVTHILANFAELGRLQRSHFLDPDLDPARIQSWLGTSARQLRAWPELGVALYELPKEPPR